MQYKLRIETYNNYIHYYLDNIYLGMLVFDKGELSDFRAIIRKNRQTINTENLYKTFKISLFSLLNPYISERLFIQKDEIEKLKSSIVNTNNEVLRKASKNIIQNNMI